MKLPGLHPNGEIGLGLGRKGEARAGRAAARVHHRGLRVRIVVVLRGRRERGSA